MTEQEALHIVRNPYGWSSQAFDDALRTLADFCERYKAAAELREGDVDLSLYGKGEPKSLEELKASHDRLFKAQIGNYLPRCPNCGYNRLDAAFWMDHRLCSNYGFFDEERRDGRAASQR